MATELRPVVQLSWRKFLSTDAGIEGMLIQRERTPSITKGDRDSMIFDAGRSEGWKECLNSFSNFIAMEKQKDIKPDND